VADFIALGMVTSVKMMECEMRTAQLTPLQHAIFQLFYFIYDEAKAVKSTLSKWWGSKS
jgi:hypothetical protein